MDFPDLNSAKAGFDTLRLLLGLVKDVQAVLPAGEKKQAVALTMEQVEKQLQIAEAHQGAEMPLLP